MAEFQEGQTATHKDGRRIIFRDGAWRLMQGQSPHAKPAAGASAETRTRIATGIGPAIDAQKNLFAEERWNTQPGNRLGSNPLNSFRGAMADMLDGPDNNAGALAKMVGGQRYQNYNQAAKTYESAFMPILSGAAVTEQEAQRLIRSDLPQRGDSPATLARKAKNRAMRLNGAAGQIGMDAPFPRVSAPQTAPRPAPSGGLQGMSDDELKAMLGL